GKLKDTRNEITGPTRAASQIGSITTLSFKTSLNTGIRTFLYLISTVSVSIGVINLLPIPSFDGGQMLVNLYLLVFKRKLKPKTYIVFHILGLVISTVLLFLLYFVDIKFYLS
ncbi:MAG: site-2 protease family protein, partial [Spirochaetales bacterium]|nr:site-2 protease family protein [Spirochaetales bacterium]